MHHTISRRGVVEDVLAGQDVKTRRNLRDMSFFYMTLVSVAVLVAVVFMLLWSKLMVVNIGYELSRADNVRSALIEKNKRLTLEFMKLKSPERIEKIASAELGLVYPAGEQVVNLK